LLSNLVIRKNRTHTYSAPQQSFYQDMVLDHDNVNTQMFIVQFNVTLFSIWMCCKILVV